MWILIVYVCIALDCESQVVGTYKTIEECEQAMLAREERLTICWKDEEIET